MKTNLARILSALLAAAALTGGSGNAPRAAENAVNPDDLRPMTAKVVELDRENDIVTVENAGGFRFAFCGCSDYCLGDYVSAIMHTNGTPGIADDYFVKVHYSGYCDYSGENLE